MVPAVSILVSSFERPFHLMRVLASIAAQRNVEKQFEVIVTDDGSQDSTESVVREFARGARFPVSFVTHRHDGFQLARCRNQGARASRAPYLLFSDGDCLLPPDHVYQHLRRRQRGTVFGSYCICLDRETTERINLSSVSSGSFLTQGSSRERFKLWKLGMKSRMYSLLRHPSKPRLFGGNVGIYDDDFCRINGYDETFQGWGCEDDDLRIRLRMAGIRVESILPWTHTYHLWHPPTDSAPSTWSLGNNVRLIQKPARLQRCLQGIAKRSWRHVKVNIAGDALTVAEIQRRMCMMTVVDASRAEIEVIAWPTNQRFAAGADCKILVAPRHSEDQVDAGLLGTAHAFVSSVAGKRANRRVPRFDNLDEALEATVGLTLPRAELRTEAVFEKTQLRRANQRQTVILPLAKSTSKRAA